MFQFCPWENRWNSVEIFPLLREKWLTMETCFLRDVFHRRKEGPFLVENRSFAAMLQQKNDFSTGGEKCFSIFLFPGGGRSLFSYPDFPQSFPKISILLENPWESAFYFCDNLRNFIVEPVIGLNLRFDRLDVAVYRRMVPVQHLSDLGQRQVQHLADHIHGHISGRADVFCASLAQNLLHSDVVLAGGDFQDVVHRFRYRFVFPEVFGDGGLDHVQRDGNSL